MKKITGYVIALAGVAGVAMYMIPELRGALPFENPIGEQALLIISLVAVAIGVFFVFKSGRGGGRRQRSTEVPIYHGKNIVGYRRT